jgi:hypothetical protein
MLSGGCPLDAITLQMKALTPQPPPAYSSHFMQRAANLGFPKPSIRPIRARIRTS